MKRVLSLYPTLFLCVVWANLAIANPIEELLEFANVGGIDLRTDSIQNIIFKLGATTLYPADPNAKTWESGYRGESKGAILCYALRSAQKEKKWKIVFQFDLEWKPVPRNVFLTHRHLTIDCAPLALRAFEVISVPVSGKAFPYDRRGFERALTSAATYKLGASYFQDSYGKKFYDLKAASKLDNEIRYQFYDEAQGVGLGLGAAFDSKGNLLELSISASGRRSP